MNTNREIDHLVYAVPDLEKAMEWLEEQTGVRPVFGGYHQTQGSKNALLHLGKAIYLEILAIDSSNTSVESPLWMGLDVLQTPKITRWAIKSSSLEEDSDVLKEYHPEMGLIRGGARKTPQGDLLKWEMILPLANPEVEIIPFMVDWRGSETHPTSQLFPFCRLMDIQFLHPEPPQVTPTFKALEIESPVLVHDQPRITAQIETPKGILWL